MPHKGHELWVREERGAHLGWWLKDRMRHQVEAAVVQKREPKILSVGSCSGKDIDMWDETWESKKETGGKK